MRTAVRCTSCGADAADPSARWCGHCGTPLAAGPSAERRTEPTAFLVLDDELEAAPVEPAAPLRARLVALGAILGVLGGLVAVQASRQQPLEARGLTARGDATRDGVVSLVTVAAPTAEAWSTTLTFPPRISDDLRVLPAGDVVYVVDLGRTGGVTAHAAADGAVLWNRRDIGTAVVPPVVVGDTLLLQEVGQAVVALGADGEVRWREDRPLGDRQAVADALLEIADGELVDRDPVTGAERWRLDVEEQLGASPQYLLAGGASDRVLLVADRPVGITLGTAPEIEEPLLAVLDAADGRVLRTVDLSPQLAWSQSPVAVDGDLLVTADVTEVTFTRLSTGEETARFPHRLSNRPLAVAAAGGRALLLDGSGTLVAIAPDGTWVWSQTAALPASVAVRDGVVLLSSATRVTAVRAGDGAVIGGQPVPADARRGPAAVDGSVHVVREDGELVRYDLDGGIAWRVPTPVAELAAPAVAPEGLVVTATGDGVSVHRAADGSRVWAFRSGRPDASLADEITTPAVSEDIVIVSPPATQATGVGGIYALRRTTGILVWDRLDDQLLPRGPLTLDRDLVLVPVGNELHGYDPEGGRRALAARSDGPRGPIAASGGVIVATTPVTSSGGADGRTVRAVTRADRSERWQVAAPVCTPPAIAGDTVLVGTSDGVLALDVADGAQRWLVGLGPSCQDLAVMDGLVIASVGIRELVGVELSTGDVSWRRSLPDAAATSAVVMGREVVVPLLDGRLLGLDLVDGTVVWEHQLSGVAASPPVVVDDRVVLLLRDGRLVGLG